MAKGSLFGLLSEVTLPEDRFLDSWDRIVVDQDLKHRMVNFLLFSMLRREGISSVALPVHGILLLQGSPGTGKTTLGHGVADHVARKLEQAKGEKTSFAELDCHGIGSGVLGETPKHMDRIFERSIPDLARGGAPTIVLLDEVENVAVARRKASLEANPMDVHRTTNALLTGLDAIRESFPNVAFIATSNFPESIDEAFLSRVDVAIDVPLPGRTAIGAILRDTLVEVRQAAARDGVDAVDEPPSGLIDALTGWDARQVRKLILQAIIADAITAEDPASLTWNAVLLEAKRGLSETSAGSDQR